MTRPSANGWPRRWGSTDQWAASSTRDAAWLLQSRVMRVDMRNLISIAAAMMVSACATTPVPPIRPDLPTAIQRVFSARPDLALALNRQLPPTSLKAQRAESGGWYIAVVTEGSGRPGILGATCVLVQDNGRMSVSELNVPIGTEVMSIYLPNCTGVRSHADRRPIIR